MNVLKILEWKYNTDFKVNMFCVGIFLFLRKNDAQSDLILKFYIKESKEYTQEVIQIKFGMCTMYK